MRDQVRVEPRGAVLGLELAVRPMGALREVAGTRHPQRVGLRDDERARALGPAQPLLTRDRVEVDAVRVHRHRAHRLRAVDEHGDPGRRAQLLDGQHRARRPQDVRDGEQARARGDRRRDVLGIRLGDDDRRARHVQRSEQSEVLVRGGDDLVALVELEPREHDVAAVRRGSGQRDALGRHVHELRDCRAENLPQGEDALELRRAPAPFPQPAFLLHAHRLERVAGERADAPRLQVRVALEDGKARTCGSGRLRAHGGILKAIAL